VEEDRTPNLFAEENVSENGEETAEDAIEAVEPELDPEAVAALAKELDECRGKRDEYLDGWQRSLADFSNYKKRIERDQAETYRSTTAKIIRRYLDILDDLERALKNRPVEGEGASWADGIDLIYRKLRGYIESEGVVPMDAQDALFDPNFHEAVAIEDNDDYESGQIIEVLQAGYMHDGKVLRPARVRVAQ
jgi:molecular chaperone GrpE